MLTVAHIIYIYISYIHIYRWQLSAALFGWQPHHIMEKVIREPDIRYTVNKHDLLSPVRSWSHYHCFIKDTHNIKPLGHPKGQMLDVIFSFLTHRAMNTRWQEISSCRCYSLDKINFDVTIPGPQFNIKMWSYQYRKSHRRDKTTVSLSYLHNAISYTGKMMSYWIRALVFM